MASSFLETTTINKSTKSVTQIPYWFSELMGSTDKVTDTATAYTYVPLIFRAVTLIANSVASVPVKFYKASKTRDGKEVETEWPFREGFSNLIWKATASMCLTGSAFWERVQNDYAKPQNVLYRNPYSITVEYRPLQQAILFTQNVTGTNVTGTQWVNFPEANRYQIVYFADFDPANDVTNGVGNAEVALTNAQLLRYMDRFAAKFFEGGAMPVTFLGMDINTPDTEVKRVERIVKNMISSIANAFNVVGIRAGAITTQQLTPPIKDLAMTELYQQALSNVALAFGIPKTMLQDAANYATAKEHRKGFYDETIIPKANRLRDVINTQLLTDVGARLDFDFGSLPIYQEDEEKRAQVFKLYVEAGLHVLNAAELSGIELTDEQLLRQQEQPTQPTQPALPQEQDDDPMQEDLKRWQRKATKRLKDGKGADCDFESEHIPESMKGAIMGALESVQSVKDISDIFTNVLVWAEYP
ncbi:MAG: phage portal protein [Chitinophagales bacterium]|nr:phage portal protein [Chitinophagales bacterium]